MNWYNIGHIWFWIRFVRFCTRTFEYTEGAVQVISFTSFEPLSKSNELTIIAKNYVKELLVHNVVFETLNTENKIKILTNRQKYLANERILNSGRPTQRRHVYPQLPLNIYDFTLILWATRITAEISTQF